MTPFKRTINIGGERIKIPAGFGGRSIIIFFFILFIFILLLTSIYKIDTEQIGVVLRFGKFVRTTNPGLHTKIPLNIERVMKIPVQRQLKMEFGFRTASPGIRTQYQVTEQSKKESEMLTGDLNVAIVEWIVQYKINDPYKYLFKVRDVNTTFRSMNEAIVRKIVGDHSVDEVVTIGREQIALKAKEELQKLCDDYEIGIEVDQLIFQNVTPPDPVKPSFNEVNEALQEKEKKINDAWAEYNEAIPRAEGEAKQMIQAAEGYAMERVNRAKGDVKRFMAIYNEYKRAPLVTRKRLYLEAMNDILGGIKKKIIMDEKNTNILPLLNLDREVKK